MQPLRSPWLKLLLRFLFLNMRRDGYLGAPAGVSRVLIVPAP